MELTITAEWVTTRVFRRPIRRLEIGPYTAEVVQHLDTPRFLWMVQYDGYRRIDRGHERGHLAAQNAAESAIRQHQAGLITPTEKD